MSGSYHNSKEWPISPWSGQWKRTLLGVSSSHFCNLYKSFLNNNWLPLRLLIFSFLIYKGIKPSKFHERSFFLWYFTRQSLGCLSPFKSFLNNWLPLSLFIFSFIIYKGNKPSKFHERNFLLWYFTRAWLIDIHAHTLPAVALPRKSQTFASLSRFLTNCPRGNVFLRK